MALTVDTDSDQTGDVDDAATLADLHRQRIGPHIGVRTSI